MNQTTHEDYLQARFATLTPSERAIAEARRKQIEGFKSTERAQRLRRQLYSQNHHCDNCGRVLQIGDNRQRRTYAHVVQQAERLACGECIKTVVRLWHAEHDPDCYLDEWKPEAELAAKAA